MADQQHRAFVTGGAGGLGSEISRQLASNGTAVAIGYKQNSARADALAASIRDQGGTAVAVEIDISDANAVETAVAHAAQRLGGLSAVVNNAGSARGGGTLKKGDLTALTPELWDALMAVNVRGPYLVARAAVPFLRQSGRGRIVNIGSTISLGPWGADAAYTPSKGAVEALTRFLAASLAPDITVNMIAPGLMEGTDMSAGASDAYVQNWRTRALLDRTTATEDVARQVVALISSSTMTGQTITIDGGIHFG